MVRSVQRAKWRERDVRSFLRYCKSGGNIFMEIIEERRKAGQNKRTQLIQRVEKIFKKW